MTKTIEFNFSFNSLFNNNFPGVTKKNEAQNEVFTLHQLIHFKLLKRYTVFT